MIHKDTCLSFLFYYSMDLVEKLWISAGSPKLPFYPHLYWSFDKMELSTKAKLQKG